MTPLHLSGLIAAPHTPMTPDGRLHVAAIPDQINLLLEGNISAAFICGTTGEGLSLSKTERYFLAHEWSRLAPPSLPIIVHVGDLSIVESQALAAQAQSAGAHAIATLAPFFFKPQTVADLVDFCIPIAAAAPELPFYFYHLPSMTGVHLPMTDFLRQAQERIPTFAGIKYTHGDLMELQQCLALAGDSLDILFGRDEMLLAALSLGVKGAIGSTYNYAAPLYHRLISAFNTGDLPTARQCQHQSIRLIEILRKYGEIPAAKAILHMQGVEAGPPRRPLSPLTTAQRATLFQELAPLDIFTRIPTVGFQP